MVRCSGVYYLPVRFGQLLRCAHKRIVNIMKVYIDRNNMQVELVRFRTKMLTLFMFTFANRVTMFTAYSLDGSTHSLTALIFASIKRCCLHVQ